MICALYWLFCVLGFVLGLLFAFLYIFLNSCQNLFFQFLLCFQLHLQTCNSINFFLHFQILALNLKQLVHQLINYPDISAHNLLNFSLKDINHLLQLSQLEILGHDFFLQFLDRLDVGIVWGNIKILLYLDRCLCDLFGHLCLRCELLYQQRL